MSFKKKGPNKKELLERNQLLESSLDTTTDLLRRKIDRIEALNNVITNMRASWGYALEKTEKISRARKDRLRQYWIDKEVYRERAVALEALNKKLERRVRELENG